MQEADTAHDYKMNSLALTEEERQRLKDAYPALEKLSRNPALMEMFWPRVCNNDRWLNPTEIPWSEARTLIMSGCVREISQLHFNGLYILMTLISIIWSWLMLWYTEQPTVRIAMIRKDSSRKLV